VPTSFDSLKATVSTFWEPPPKLFSLEFSYKNVPRTPFPESRTLQVKPEPETELKSTLKVPSPPTDPETTVGGLSAVEQETELAVPVCNSKSRAKLLRREDKVPLKETALPPPPPALDEHPLRKVVALTSIAIVDNLTVFLRNMR
jgi:hypothetical protein